MKNRLRGGGGGGGGPRSLKAILRRRIQSSKLDLSSPLSVDEVVQHLRLSYPDYRRLQLQSFARTVSQCLDCLKSTARSEQCETEDDMDSTGTTIPSSRDLARKRRRNSDFGEERLARIESEHLQKSKKKFVSSTPPCSSVDEDRGGSDTDDATFEPKFDLMKSMIRSNYTAASSKPAAGKVEEKIFEVEVDDKAKKIDSAAANWSDTGNAKTNNVVVGNSEALPGIEAKKEEGPKFSDFGGMESILEELRLEVIVPCFYQPQLLKWLGVKPMTGILLHGPPGCGKTKLAHAIANEANVPFYKISATQVISGVSGESEENIRSLFSKAHRTAPSIVFIDEIDAIGSKRENLQREMEKRVVTQLLTCMDDMHQARGDSSSIDSNLSSSEKVSGHVLVIGATNRPDALDPALRRPGRFDREIALCIPDEDARVEILSVLTQKLRLEGTLDLRKIAKATSGFVGADLAEVVNRAGSLAVKRIVHKMNSRLRKEQEGMENAFDQLKNPLQAEELKGLSITASDFDEACSVVQPSSTREGFARIPDIKWEDVGGLKPLRKEFDRHVIRRIKCPEDYEAFGVDCAGGILLYGPPGCGKTLIAKAVANGAGANFIHVKGPQLLSRYVGDSELEVRKIFSRARTAAPCIIFFDEIDALTTERGKEGGWVVERLLNQLLVELDGADRRRGVYVIGATNRLEVMDRAVLRPGRLGKHLYVPLPGPDDRVQILRALARKKPLATDVDLDAIGRSEACDNLSGADLAEVMNEAAVLAMEDRDEALRLGVSSGKQRAIETSHFEKALEKIPPSVSVKQNRDFKVVAQQFKLA